MWPEDGPQWPKHVVVSIINRIQNSCVLTYPTPSLIVYNTTGMMHLKIQVNYCRVNLSGSENELSREKYIQTQKPKKIISNSLNVLSNCFRTKRKLNVAVLSLSGSSYLYKQNFSATNCIKSDLRTAWRVKQCWLNSISITCSANKLNAGGTNVVCHTSNWQASFAKNLALGGRKFATLNIFSELGIGII